MATQSKGMALHSQLGMTLLEVMLVISIMVMIMMLTFRGYEQLQRQSYVAQIKYNADVLLQAMTNYYRAQCYGTTDPSTLAPVLGTLANSSSSYYLIQLSDLLPYLPANWSANNPYINSYVLQFNRAAGSDVTVNACSQDITTGTACSTTLSSSRAQTVTWTAQVSIKTQYLTQAQVTGYKAMLAADCTSTLSGTTVKPCTQSPAPGLYLVWQRLPAATGSEAQSNLWPMTPQLKQFQLQYTHDQMYELSTGDGSMENYFCGGG